MNILVGVFLGYNPEGDAEVYRIMARLAAGQLDAVDDHRGYPIVGSGKKNGKLIPPQTGNHVFLTAGILDNAGNPGQKLIAFLMAKGIIDQLQPVDVTHDHAHRQLSFRIQPFQLFFKIGSVVEPGQLVMETQVADLIIRPLSFRDVLNRSFVEEHLPAGVADGQRFYGNPDFASVLAIDLRLVFLDDALFFDEPLEFAKSFLVNKVSPRGIRVLSNQLFR